MHKKNKPRYGEYCRINCYLWEEDQNEPKAKIIEMLRQHVSQKDISHRLGVSRRYVHRVLLELREKGEAL